MLQDTILYDLPSKGTPKCWSLNPWKARLALNYKGIPYKTQWVEYPDLKSTFESLGIQPNDPNVNPNYPYSSPAARFPDGTYVMDSRAIAQKLEEIQPEPSLHLDNGYTDKTQKAVLGVMSHLGAIALPRVPEMLLTPPSAQYFNETREKRFGMPLSELAKSEKARDAWANASESLKEMVAILKENDGPYVAGTEVSFADFVLAGLYRFLELLDEKGDLYLALMGVDDSLPKHYEACRKWFQRDD